MNLKIGKLQDVSHAISNKIFLNAEEYKAFKASVGNTEPVYAAVQNSVYMLAQASYIERGVAGLSSKQREFLKLSQSLDTLKLAPFRLPVTEYRASLIKFEVIPVRLDVRKEYPSDTFDNLFKQIYRNQFFSKGQEVYFDLEGLNYFARVTDLMLVDSVAKTQDLPYAMLAVETEFEFTSFTNPKLVIKSKNKVVKNIFRSDFRFEDMGVGGLDKEIQDIFRRAFSSRRLPTSVLEMYGVHHVKGMVLHGPPGTGKTLIARQLAKALQAKEPKIVNGPELFNKYVGETEANVRKLFDDAKADQERMGDDSPLHVIIFDEFDSIAKVRGSDNSGTGTADNIVNQLLAMIDGVDSLHNILVIGMTNRLDLIDKAVLRPGRFEVHVEIGLPDEPGRLQIFHIHTKVMKTNNLLAADVDLPKLAGATKNYTGAEIEAVVKSANSFALNRHHNLLNFQQKLVIDKPGQVEMADFAKALEEIKPEFGFDLSKKIIIGEYFDYGSRIRKINTDILKILSQVQTNSIPLASILLHGARGTGLTNIACNAALQARIPFVKYILSDDLIGRSEAYKVNYIVRCFDDAYKSKQSLMIIDDLDRVLEYVEAGKRFNPNILAAFMVVIKKRPIKQEHSLGIICTCSNIDFLREFGLYNEFNVKIKVPQISFNYNGENEIGSIISQTLAVKTQGTFGLKPTFRIGIKKLVFILGIVKKHLGQGNFDTLFREALDMVGHEDENDALTVLTDQLDLK
jgi:vesicle-fusing ATPase